MNVYVFDLEGDGLLNDITKIHCLVYSSTNMVSCVCLSDLSSIRNFLLDADILIGHNIQRFDIPVLEKLLGIKIKAKLVDTLALSWYLEPLRTKHGLEEWGAEFGIPKPPIDDWKNLTLEEYIHRCTEDVKINYTLWQRFRKHLIQIYGSWDKAKKLIDFLEFKMDCAREQERSKWRLDKAYALESIGKLAEAKEAKLATLAQHMPQIPVYSLRTRPAKPFKKDGTYSTHGAKWFSLLEKQKLPPDYAGTVREIVKYDPPNPGSPAQVKEWLYSLGWKPATFKYKREDDGTIRKIPQINLEHGGGLCPSVLALVNVDVGVSVLESLGVISHRLALLRGFMDFSGEGTHVEAQIQGFTNTLRFKHKVAVNLPKVGKPYGEEVRGCLIAEDGHELCGADMSSLEDRLKQHYIYPFDPDYVNEMNVPDYDPHLSLALLGGEVTQQQVDDYISGISKAIKPIRDIFKNGNYACQYGAGPPRLALTANISLAKAEFVWKIYWEKNWAIKEVVKVQLIKTVKGQMWLYNPIAELWYSLKYEKDIFSTLVQGSADYVFNVWVMEVRKRRSQLTAQFHDEIVLTIKKGVREKAEAMLMDAINATNNKLQLNVKLGIGIQFGDRYSEIH